METLLKATFSISPPGGAVWWDVVRDDVVWYGVVQCDVVW